MQVALIDLPERDAFALSLLIAKMRPTWRCQAASAGQMPPGDLLVLDLTRQGWRVDISEAGMDERLDALLGSRTAVLLTAPLPAQLEAREAASLWTARWAEKGWTVLNRPFRAVHMREALEQAERHVNARAHRHPMAQSVSASQVIGASTEPPITSFSTTLFGEVLDSAPVSPPAHALPPPEIGEGSLSLPQFVACAGSSPHEGCLSFLQNLGEHLEGGQPLEMHLTMINGLIFHPAENWAASNTPISALRMVCKSRSLVQHIKLNGMDARIDPAQRASQRGMRTYPMGEMLYTLARMAECQLPA
ncbi:MAG: hypothetical protein Q4F13_02940 [Pseudomonadota bacterium]|nr:hypothetical protein [Pseudomonadota bacterium]